MDYILHKIAESSTFSGTYTILLYFLEIIDINIVIALQLRASFSYDIEVYHIFI